MNILKIIRLASVPLLISSMVYAQDNDVPSLIKQGIELNNQKDYTGAIEKYKRVLVTDPDNAQANYQIAFSMKAMGKGTEGIFYLNKLTKSNSNFTGPAFELLGGIYDANHQLQQSINSYTEGLKIIAKAKPGSTRAEMLQNQLQAVFDAVGQLSEKQTGNEFFKNYYAAFFYKLSKTDNMRAFARIIGLSEDQTANTLWIKQNEDKRKSLVDWIANEDRKF